MHVYVIQSTNGLVKIGKSRQPNTRISSLQYQGGFSLDAAWFSFPVSDASDIESRSHAALSENRKIGEWFNVDFDAAVDAVISCINAPPPEPKVKAMLDESSNTVSGRINRRLNFLNKKAIELARATGLSRGNISLWTSGEVTNIRPENLVRCADFLQCEIRWLATGEGQEEIREERNILDSLTPPQRAQAVRMLEAFAASCRAEH